MNNELKDRMTHWLIKLKDDFYEEVLPIKFEAAKTMEELSYEEARKLDYTAVEEGFTWGVKYEYMWMRGKVTIPESLDGKRVVMNLHPGGESTIFVNGREFGTYRADWVREAHHFYVDNTLSRAAKAGDEYEIVLEVYAGHYYPENAITHGCATGPVIPGTYEDPAIEGQRRTLGKCSIGLFDESCYQAYMDFATLLDLYRDVLDPKSLRAAKVARGLEKFTYAVDFEQDREGRDRSYEEGRKILEPLLKASNGSTMPTFYCVGNSHIDLAWLWPVHETNRKTARTFAAQLRLMEEYPDYVYLQSTPASYEMCRKYYPDLYDRIVAQVKKGQWIAEGAMWVEPDTNMASGEALVRQLLYGKAYYKKVFGVDSVVLWLPDTFGYTGALPQILKSCGVKYLVTQKIYWTYNGGEQFPYHYFNWEGVDGTSIQAFLPTSYTYNTIPSELMRTWNNRAQTEDLDSFLIPYGYGDGGGGPVRDMIEYCKRQEDLEGAVRVRMTDPVTMFDDLDAQGGPVNTYSGELYFSCHRGTYTSQAREKYFNRKSEILMQMAESVNAIAAFTGAKAYPQADMEELWKIVLFHQFHDILPGSGIAEIYRDAAIEFEKFFDKANALRAEGLSDLTDGSEGISVFNSLSFARKSLIKLPDSYKGAAYTDGSKVMTAELEDGRYALVDLPACGMVSILPADESVIENGVYLREENGSYVLGNSKLEARISDKGEVSSFVLKASGREFVKGTLNRFRIYKDVPRVFDAWDIDENYLNQEMEGARDVAVKELLVSPLRSALKISFKIGNSTVDQTISLTAEADRLEFDTIVDWNELHRLLKVDFSADVYAENAKNEMQFGFVERPTKRSTQHEKDRFEVCNHRYTALSDASHGVAVLNDCKYGISMLDNTLSLTLLRAPESPDPTADRGINHFTYAFVAYEGDFGSSPVVREGLDLNYEPVITEGTGSEGSFFELDKENIILDTIKLAEDGSGDLILRLYDSKKAAGRAVLSSCLTFGKVSECDMLENVTKELKLSTENGKNCVALDFRAFEVKTLRLGK
ncbi:alpha-mannosidase [Butyrivibrio sp. MC2013]|uniref:alpha-mannosidase n=1 Tax=Butyrivibrio sp. MC2013 TaxID=1280686 RepID=UPI000427544C|nr:glycoside hydrolase family 38 C-terminal domain-containing protein [Butyrivibrio sp. MC2013]